MVAAQGLRRFGSWPSEGRVRFCANGTPTCGWAGFEMDDLSSAFGHWSKHAEESLRQATTVEGSQPGRRYLGRACQPVPVKQCLAAPRFKQGRPMDFRVQEPWVAILGSCCLGFCFASRVLAAWQHCCRSSSKDL